MSQNTDPWPIFDGSKVANYTDNVPARASAGPFPLDAADASVESADGTDEADTSDSTGITASEDAVEPRIVTGELLTAEDAAQAQSAMSSRKSWRSMLAFLGLSRGPSKAELEAQRAQLEAWETTIRQQTWTRAVNIAVVSAKGGDGSTPAALLTGGILATIRGGGVGVFEATIHPGGLALRAEGEPRRGLSELVNATDMIQSAGNLAGYTGPQTSHAAVIGTVNYRPQLRPEDVRNVRRVLDTYYQVTVADLDHNLSAPTSLAAQRSADAVIIPCTFNALSIAKAVETVRHLERSAPHLFERSLEDLAVAVVIGHDGSPEEPELVENARTVLNRELHGRVQVIESPYDPIFTSRKEIALADALPGTRAAWTHAVASIIKHINDFTPVTFDPKEN